VTDLRSQRRLAAQILKVGENRVWMDPDRTDDIEAAMTREEIKKLAHEGTIKRAAAKGVSRGRARVLHEKKKKGRRRGLGTRGGSAHSRISRKESWMSRIRALRKRLRNLKDDKIVSVNTYRHAYKLASSGRFESVADLERYLKSHELWRKR
jgi:large subunit ribosomal protein L19e